MREHRRGKALSEDPIRFESMASDKKVRGFSFFFWVSASLFILAAANWTFNKLIDLSTLVSLGWSIVVLFLAILFVAAFLNLTYNAVPNVRNILNGVLGLDKEHCTKGPNVVPTNIQESDKGQAKFDKDVELLKVSIISEELRGRYYTVMGALFSLLTAILAAIIALSVTVSDGLTKLGWLGILGIIGFAVATTAFRTITRYREQVPQVDSLIETIEKGQKIDTVEHEIDRIAGRK